MKRGLSQTSERIARATVMGRSKAALADLVIDLLRQHHASEGLDGEPLAQAFVEAYEPIAYARGERPPKVWTPRTNAPRVK